MSAETGNSTTESTANKSDTAVTRPVFLPQKSKKLPIWIKIPVFPIALIMGIIIGSVAGCLVGLCLLLSWCQDQYEQFFYPEKSESADAATS